MMETFSKKKIFLIGLIALFILMFGLPIGASFANKRTIMPLVIGPLRLYDTTLDLNTLTPNMFVDVVNLQERYGTNPLAQLLGLLIDRRVEILSVDASRPEYPYYTIQIYTYFNIPLDVYQIGTSGGEPTLSNNDTFFYEF